MNVYRTILIFLMLSLFCLTAFSQVKFRGKVISSAGKVTEPLDFASVVLVDIVDTTTIIASSITDTNGDFVFYSLQPKKYRIVISRIGFWKLISEIKVVYPSAGNEFVKNFVLELKSEQMEEVTVVGKRPTQQSIDKTVYNITSSQLKNSVNSMDLLAGLSKLSLDYANQKITTVNGEKVKVLINGANATEQELYAINAQNVKSVEYYDFPPAKYANYPVVVNIITKHANDGLYGGVNLTSAFTTGFINGGMFINYNWKNKNQLKFNASTYYRNYSHIESSNNYEYQLNDKYHFRREFEKRKFGYDDNYISIIYSRNVEDKYQLQIKFEPNFQHSHRDGALQIDQYIGQNEYDRTGVIWDRTKQFTPSLDVYSVINLSKGKELMVNLTGTYINADKRYSRREYKASNEELELLDNMTSNNVKKSLMGHIDYTMPINKMMRLSIGNKFSVGRLTYSIDNSFGNGDFFTNQNSNNTYAEIRGKWMNFSYRFNIGLGYYDNSSDEARQNAWMFEPQMLIGYNITPNNIIRFSYKNSTTMPSLTELSSNKIYISEGIVKEGNPFLKNTNMNRILLVYDYNNPWLSMRIGGVMQHKKDPTNSFFIEEDGLIRLKYENANYALDYGALTSLYFDPFKNKIFTITVGGTFSRTRINSNIVGEYTKNQFSLNYEVASKIKEFTFSYSANVRDWQLSGPYLNLGEKNSTLMARYTYKNFSVTAVVLWFLVDADYKSRTLNESLVKYNFVNNIIDNKSMFTLGIIYNFGVGKKYNESERRLNNRDRDAGLF